MIENVKVAQIEKLKKQSSFIFEFCCWKDPPHPVNWSPTNPFNWSPNTVFHRYLRSASSAGQLYCPEFFFAIRKVFVIR